MVRMDKLSQLSILLDVFTGAISNLKFFVISPQVVFLEVKS
jgi:hypothetical protein